MYVTAHVRLRDFFTIYAFIIMLYMGKMSTIIERLSRVNASESVWCI